MAQPLTAAVIGAGMGGTLSLDALVNSPHYTLVAAVDLRDDALAALRARIPGLATYTSADALFARRDLDVICVSTYAPTHHELALRAMDAGVKGLLVEKPVGDTAAAGAAIVAAADARDLPLVVPHGLAVMRHSREICERVWAGEIGALRVIEIECANWDIINAGIHWLHFAVTLLRGEAMRYVLCAADAGTRTYRDGMQVETLAVTYAESASGVRVVMQTGDYVNTQPADKKTLFRLYGTHGHIEFYAWESGYVICNGAHPQPTRYDVERNPISNHQVYLDALASQIHSGARDRTNAQYSLAALELCEAAFVSREHRCSVPLPLAQFTPPAQVDWRIGSPYAGHGGGRDGRKLP